MAVGGWRRDLLDPVGVDDLPLLDGPSAPTRAAGQPHGVLAPAVAASLELPAGIPVAAGLIDTHAAALGVLGRGFRARMNEFFLIAAGHRTTGLAFAQEARTIPGASGPFRDAVLPGVWLNAIEPPDAGDTPPEVHAAEFLAVLNANGCAITRVAIAGDRALAQRCRKTLAADVVVTEAAHPALLGTAMAAGLRRDLFIALDRMLSVHARYAAA